jgi:hypothetical protein
MLITTVFIQLSDFNYKHDNQLTKQYKNSPDIFNISASYIFPLYFTFTLAPTYTVSPFCTAETGITPTDSSLNHLTRTQVGIPVTAGCVVDYPDEWQQALG